MKCSHDNLKSNTSIINICVVSFCFYTRVVNVNILFGWNITKPRKKWKNFENSKMVINPERKTTTKCKITKSKKHATNDNLNVTHACVIYILTLHSLLCSVLKNLCLTICSIFLLAIVLSVLLRFTASDYMINVELSLEVLHF
jgi:hypothetical protein